MFALGIVLAMLAGTAVLLGGLPVELTGAAATVAYLAMLLATGAARGLRPSEVKALLRPG
jgi:hypothetical protein